jgi:hypothetical protein
VDPVPDPLLLRKSGSAANRTRTCRSVARNCDHQTTEMILHTPNTECNGNQHFRDETCKWKGTASISRVRFKRVVKSNA